MIFRTLSDAELSRWVTASPRDFAAKGELFKRAAAILDGTDDRIRELECQVTDCFEEVNRLEQELAHFLD